MVSSCCHFETCFLLLWSHKSISLLEGGCKCHRSQNHLNNDEHNYAAEWAMLYVKLCGTLSVKLSLTPEISISSAGSCKPRSAAMCSAVCCLCDPHHRHLLANTASLGLYVAFYYVLWRFVLTESAAFRLQPASISNRTTFVWLLNTARWSAVKCCCFKETQIIKWY